MRHAAYRAASATAIAAALAACSQPASHATVDLSGSYQDYQPQTYSAATGLPVYRAQTVYGARPSQHASAAPVYEDAGVYATPPANQVASLDYSVGAPVYNAAPVASAPALYDGPGSLVTDYDAELGARDGAYVHVGDYGGGVRTAALPPVYAGPETGAVAIDAAPIYDGAGSLPVSEDYAQIEVAPLEPLSPRPEERVAQGVPYMVDDSAPFYSAPVADYGQPVPVYDGPASVYEDARPIYEASPGVAYEDLTGGYLEESPAPVAAPAPQIYEPAPVAPVSAPPQGGAYPRPYESLRPGVFPAENVGGGYVSAPPRGQVYAEMAAPVYDPAPYAFETAPSAMAYEPRGMRAPVATAPFSDGYDRAYDHEYASAASPAASYESYEVMAPVQLTGPVHDPQAVAIAPRAPVRQYEIRKGDTLYGIARRHSVTPQELARANNLSMESTIYPGQMLVVPARGGPGAAPRVLRPDVVQSDGEAVPMVEIGALESAPASPGAPGARFATVSDPAPALEPARVRTAPETDLRAETRPALQWPAHGDIYRLGDGEIEIAAPGGSMVSAAAAGRVARIENGPAGALVAIDHGGGWRSVVVGLEAVSTQIGRQVAAGEPLGRASHSHRVRFALQEAGGAS